MWPARTWSSNSNSIIYSDFTVINKTLNAFRGQIFSLLSIPVCFWLPHVFFFLPLNFSFDAAGLATGVAPGVILCVADGAQDATPRVRFCSASLWLHHFFIYLGKREVSLSLHTDPTDVEVPDLEGIIIPQAFWPLARLFRQHRCAL